MSETAANTYLVNPDTDPVLIAIQGRASFQNSSAINRFLSEQLAAGKKNYAMDFQNCTTIDSTFLGILAGHALSLRKLTPPGTLILCRLGERNTELIQNLGLHRLLILDTTPPATGDKPPSPSTPLPSTPAANNTENTRLILNAHENLVAADSTNHAKFKDVLEYLRDSLKP